MGTLLHKERVVVTGKEPDLVAHSEAVLTILEQLRTIALSNSTVLLIGETGVGKERFAEYLHQHSARHQRPLVRIGVASIPRELVESELFGYERGAFTSATSEKKGLFEVASGGSLFLDDIDDLPIEVQPKLLRALESREIQHVGGTRSLPIDVRFIAATKAPLRELVDQGKFRADLFYRLNVVPIVIPPLRERREDIPALVEFYLNVLAPEKNISVTRGALRALLNYSWPGNVRELKNILHRLVLFVTDDITAEDLPPEIRLENPLDMLMKSCSHCFVEEQLSYSEIIRCLEANLLHRALEMHRGNKSQAAQYLGLKLSTFRDKLKKFHIADFR